jgi:hypothetical protein
MVFMVILVSFSFSFAHSLPLLVPAPLLWHVICKTYGFVLVQTSQAQDKFPMQQQKFWQSKQRAPGSLMAHSLQRNIDQILEK